MKNNKALFIDRDGVINADVKYENGYDSPQKVEEVKLINGIERVISWANHNNIRVVKISNQPGVSKGKISMDLMVKIDDKINQLLKEKGAKIDNQFICYHHPRGVIPEYSIECECRKPKPGLILQAAKELDIDLRKSVMLGDRDWDVMAGRAASCTTILYLPDDDNYEKKQYALKSKPDFKVNSIDSILPILIKFFT